MADGSANSAPARAGDIRAAQASRDPERVRKSRVQARRTVLELLAIQGGSGNEKDVADQIVRRLRDAGCPADAISFDFDADGGYTAADALREIADEPRTAAELVEMLAGLPALLADAGEVIAKLSAECAGLRARGE